MMENNLKFKNIINKGAFILCTLVLVFSSFIFSACKPKNKLDMNYYTLTNSTYTLATKNEKTSTPSKDFIGNNKIKRQYLTTTINLSSEWLYLFYIEKFEFTIETNKTVELEFDITLTNLKTGEYNGVLDVKSKTYTLVCEQVANKPSTYYMDINDIVELSAANTCVIFNLNNFEVYKSDSKINDLAFSISNFSLYGNHKIK